MGLNPDKVRELSKDSMKPLHEQADETLVWRIKRLRRLVSTVPGMKPVLADVVGEAQHRDLPYTRPKGAIRDAAIRRTVREIGEGLTEMVAEGGKPEDGAGDLAQALLDERFTFGRDAVTAREVHHLCQRLGVSDHVGWLADELYDACQRKMRKTA